VAGGAAANGRVKKLVAALDERIDGFLGQGGTGEQKPGNRDNRV
jgi:hypothetical protein